MEPDHTPDPLARHAKRFRGHIRLTSGIALVILAAGLGLLIGLRSSPIWADEKWMEQILELRGPVGDAFAFAMDWLGGGIVGVFGVPMAAAAVLLIARRPWAAFYFIITPALSAGAVQLLKDLFGRARPEEIIIDSDFGSYPSGHVANAATIAVTLAVIFPHLWVWILGAVYTVLMALSRIYLGAHWLTDTIGGALVGTGVALVLWAPLAVVLASEREYRVSRLPAAADPSS
jgi:membrane-associated phospholipid phosphatase